MTADRPLRPDYPSWGFTSNALPENRTTSTNSPGLSFEVAGSYLLGTAAGDLAISVYNLARGRFKNSGLYAASAMMGFANSISLHIESDRVRYRAECAATTNINPDSLPKFQLFEYFKQCR